MAGKYTKQLKWHTTTNCFRKLVGYKICTSASKIFIDNRVHHFSVLRRNFFFDL